MGALKESERFIAGFYLEQAWLGRRTRDLDLEHFYERVTRSKRQVARAKRLFSMHRALVPLARQAVVLLVLLTCFERPWWCAGRHRRRAAR